MILFIGIRKKNTSITLVIQNIVVILLIQWENSTITCEINVISLYSHYVWFFLGKKMVVYVL